MDLPDDLAADLAALADGRLEAARRAEVEARLAADPALQAALERQRAAVRVVTAAAADVYAPHDLRLRIDGLQGRRQARPRRRWGPLSALAGAVAAAAIVLVLVTGGGVGVQDVLAAATRPPVAAASPATTPGLLRDSQDGVPFPNYLKKFGWRAVGTRTDSIGGRPTRTVFYVKDGRRIAYTIVGGSALDAPGGSAPLESDGVRLRVLRSHGRSVVTWQRRGHTCVLSATNVPRGELVQLAAWKAKGKLPF